MPKLIGALLMYRKDNVQHISKICNGAVVRYHATATASFKGRINESYNASTDCAQQAQVWSMQRGNCVCVFYYEVCLWGAQALQTNQGMILYKLFPVPQRNCQLMEHDSIQGTIAHQEKRLLPTQPHDTLSLGPIRLLAFLAGASFLHIKSLFPQGAARSISWEETPRGEQCELEGRIKVYEAKNLLSRRTHTICSVILTKMPRLQYPTPVDSCCFFFFFRLEWWNLTRSGYWRGRTNPKRRQNSSWRFFPCPESLHQGTCRQFGSRKSE